MTSNLELAKKFEQFILLPVSAYVDEALAALRKSDAIFAVMGDTNHPQTLIREEHLSNLAGEVSRSLSEFLDRLPPLLVVDGEVAFLDAEDLKQFADLLQQTKAPGLVVYQDNQVVGVVSRSVISRALPLTVITPTSTKRLYGDAKVPIRTFVCRKCTPPSRRRPRQGEEAPICPRDWLHGPMEREYL